LFEAARRLGVAPEACLYVGDDERDVIAGRAAGMATAVAAWGYLGPQAKHHRWGADIEMITPGDLLKALGLA
jgi:phosphoglycolate phosphatase